LRKLFTARGLSVAGNGDILNEPVIGVHLKALKKIAMLNIVKKIPQFFFKQAQIQIGRSSFYKFRHLAVNAAPVAGVIGIEINAN
jgi:hypothetical protein